MLAVLMAATIAGPAEPPSGLALSWSAPAGCPTEAEVRARVVQMTGEQAARSATLSARATVREASPGRWALTLELTGATGSGRRELTAPRCEELLEAAALVVAIAVDPRAALAGPTSAPDPGVVPAPPQDMSQGSGSEGQVVKDMSEGPKDMSQDAGPPPPADEPGLVDEPVEAPPAAAADPGSTATRGRLRVGLRAAAGVSFARILPRTSAAVNLAVSLGGRHWRAELAGTYAPPVAGGTAAIGGLFQAGAVELRGCPVLRRKTIEVPLCVGLQIGAMEGRGRGSGLTTTTTARSLWLAGTLGAALAWRPRGGRVAPWLQADMIVALVRPSFVTAGQVQVHQASRFGGQVLAGIEVSLR